MASSEASLPAASWDLSSAHSGALLRMERLVQQRSGFTLLIAGYGDSTYRERVAGYLASGWLGGAMVDARDAQGDFIQLEGLIEAASATGAVQVVGLDRWPSGQEALWKAFNYDRERLASLCPVPLVLWVPRVEVRVVATEAPDLWAWRSGVFDLSDKPSRLGAEIAGSPVDRGSADAAERVMRIGEITTHLDALESVDHPADLALLVERGELVADLGQPDEALLDFKAAVLGFLAIDDRLGEANAKGHVADVHYQRGDLDEALRIRTEEELPVYERLGDVRAKAVTWGQIADVHYQRGDLDEALRIRTEEELPVYERLGDQRSKAVTRGKIADVHYRRGDLDEALRIRTEEELPVYERLGEVRAKAVTWGQIADVHYRRGDLDEALRIRTEEELPVYERLGDQRSKAVTRGKIADVHYRRGDLDEALRIHTEEELPVYERLGDIDGLAVAHWRLAWIDLARHDVGAAVSRMLTAYQLLERTGRADGLAVVGETLGSLLRASGEAERGTDILRRSSDSYERLGRTEDAQRVTRLIAGDDDDHPGETAPSSDGADAGGGPD